MRPLTYHAVHRMFERAKHGPARTATLHALRHTAAYRMAEDPGLPLTDVQFVLGHAPLTTTQLYLTPRKEDVVRRVLAHHAEQTRQAAERVQAAPAPGYRPETLQVLFGGDDPDVGRAASSEPAIAAGAARGCASGGDRVCSAAGTQAGRRRSRTARASNRLTQPPFVPPKRHRRHPGAYDVAVGWMLDWLLRPARRDLAGPVAGQRRGRRGRRWRHIPVALAARARPWPVMGA